MLNEWSMPDAEVHKISNAHTKIWFNDMLNEEKNKKDQGYLNAKVDSSKVDGSKSRASSIGGSSIMSSSQVSHESKGGEKDQDKVMAQFKTSS